MSNADRIFARASSHFKSESGIYSAREKFNAEENAVPTGVPHKIEASLFRFAETLNGTDQEKPTSKFRSLSSALGTVFPSQDKHAIRSGPFRVFVIGAAMAAVFITFFSTVGTSLMIWAKGLLDSGDPTSALGLAIAGASLLLIAAIIHMLIRLPV